MGQVNRMMKYDREANERNAIGALNFVNNELSWYRLDDGVMGGQSESNHSCLNDGSLHFEGEINTNGGGINLIGGGAEGGRGARGGSVIIT